MNILKKFFTALMMGTILFSFGALPAHAQDDSLVSPAASVEPSPQPEMGPAQPTSTSQTTVIVEASPEPSLSSEASVNPEATQESQPTQTPEPTPVPPQPATQPFIVPSPVPTPTPQTGFNFFSWKGFFNLDSFFDQFWGTRFQASMDGSQEAGQPGDQDGAGRAMLETYPSDGKICLVLKTTGLNQPQTISIHRGSFGTENKAIVKLPLIMADGVGSGCIIVDNELLKDLRKNPFNYYIDITTADYPDGAIRGQLSRQ